MSTRRRPSSSPQLDPQNREDRDTQERLPVQQPGRGGSLSMAAQLVQVSRPPRTDLPRGGRR
jgi:hypothetical protein